MAINDDYKNQLLNSIPVIKSMNLEIVKVKSNSLTLMAPLNENINYEGTAFGGSINTLCVLSSYLLIHHILKSNRIKFSSLVIQDSSIQYIKPVDSDFIAKAQTSSPQIDRFIKALHKKESARISIEAFITCGTSSEIKAQFKSRFVTKL